MSEIDSDTELELALPEIGPESDAEEDAIPSSVLIGRGQAQLATQSVISAAHAVEVGEDVTAKNVVHSSLPSTGELVSCTLGACVDHTAAEPSPASVTSMQATKSPITTIAPVASSSTPPTSAFKLPFDPSIPQDLSLIAELVATHQVVGALPKLGMTAAEKRRLVEESIRSKAQGKGKAPETAETASTSIPATPAVQEDDSSSESSSEFESSSEEEGSSEEEREEDGKAGRAVDLTGIPHSSLKRELDGLLGRETMTDSEEDDDEEEEEEGYSGIPGQGVQFEFSDSPFPTPQKRQIDLEMFDDEEGTSGGPITSIHEAVLPPVALPPVERVPLDGGKGLSLAGEVVSWMKEKRVELWLEEQGKKEEESREEETKTNKSTQLDVEGVDAGADVTLAEEGEVVEQVEQPAEDLHVASEASSSKAGGSAKPTPKFTSAGTVVIRAMQSRPGADDEGWLEEGSVVCWEDGRVAGTVRLTSSPISHLKLTLRCTRHSDP